MERMGRGVHRGRLGLAAAAAAWLACAAPQGAPPPSEPRLPAPAATPARSPEPAGDLGLVGDPTGRWERSMARFDAAQFRGDLVESRTLALEAVALSLGFDELDVRVDRTQQAIDLLVRAYLRERRTDDALSFLLAVESEAERRNARHHPVALHGLERRGWLHLRERDLDRAEAALTEFISATDPDAPQVLGARVQLANVLASRGQVEEAAAMARAALESRAARAHTPEVLEARTLLGWLLALQGRPREAIPVWSEVRDLARQKGLHHHVAKASHLLGCAWMMEGDLNAAAAAFDEAERAARMMQPFEFTLIPVWGAQGEVALLRGNLSRALSLQGRALELAESAFGGSHAATAQRAIALASSHWFAGDADAARRLVEGARGAVDRGSGASALEALDLKTAIAFVEARVGYEHEAVRHSREVAQESERIYGKGSPASAMARVRYAFALVEAGEAGRAVSDAEQALEVLSGHFGPEHVATAEALATLARARAGTGRPSQALALLERALPIFERAYGPSSPVVAETLEARAYALRQVGRSEEAERDTQRLASLRASYRAAAAAAGAWGGVVEVAEFNFRLKPSNRAWLPMDPTPIPNARAAFHRQSPQVAFAVFTEPASPGLEYTPELLEKAVTVSLQMQNDRVELERSGKRTIAGIDGAELLFRLAGRGAAHRIAIWAGAHGGQIYRLTTSADERAVTSEELLRCSDEMLAAFSLIDPNRAPSQPEEPGVRFASERFGYELDLRDKGWISWSTQAADQPYAEFGALHPAGGVVLVLPVSLLGTDPGERIALGALLRMLEVEWPATPRRIVVGDLRGVEADFTRSSQGTRYSGRARVLKGPDAAYAVLVLAEERLGDRLPELLGVVDAVSFPARGPGRLDASELTASEKRRHARAFNEMGLAYQQIGSRGEAIRFLGIAHDLAPEDLVIAKNLVHVQIEAGRYAEVIEALAGEPARFADNVELLAYRAIAREQAGDPAGAIQDYEAAFELGLEDNSYLADFAGLLWQAGEQERAYQTLDAAIAENGSLSLRTTRAALRRQAGEYDAAIEELEEIEALGAADASALIELILAYSESGRHHEAIEACKRYESSLGRSAGLLVQRARSEYALGLYREAKASLDSALRLEPDSTVAKEFQSLLAATLGEGDASLLRDPIDPVPFPDELVKNAQLDEDSLADAGAGYVHWVEAVRFSANEARTRTVYLRGEIADSRGADELSTVRFAFHPLWERIWVNELVVRDASGSVVSRQDGANVYVLDASSEDEIKTSGKVLHISIPGLRSGATFDLVVTRQDHQPAERFQLLDRVLSAGVPVAVSALFVTGDLDQLAEWRSPEVVRKAIGDGVAWIARAPIPWRWEPMQGTSLAYLPRVLLGDKRDTWEQLAKGYLGEIAEFLGPDAAVHEAAPENVFTARSSREKAARAARFVQETLTYKALLFGVRARIPNTPEAILRNRFGDCKDHSILLFQLLAEAGLKPRLALVSVRQPIEPSIPSLDQFDHMIVYCEACGESGFLDATDKDLHPASVVPRGVAGRYALVLDAEDPRLLRIPSYSAERHTVSIHRRIEISDEGTASVREEAVLSGHWGASYRGVLREAEPRQWQETLQQQLFDGYRGSVLTGMGASNVDDPSQPLELRLEYEVRGWFTPSGTRLVGRIPAVLESSYLRATPIESRVSPFEIRFPLRLRSTVELRAPQGFQVGRAPAEKHRAGAKYLDFEGSVESHADEVVVTFDASRRPGCFTASEYTGYYREAESAVRFFDGAVELAPR